MRSKKISFAERLVKESGSRQKTSIEKHSSIEIKGTPLKQNPKTKYLQFKQQHNELKNMLKLFDGPRQSTSQISPQIFPITPVRNRLYERRANPKTSTVLLRPPAFQGIKQEKPQIVSSPEVQLDFRSYNSVNLPSKRAISPRASQNTRNGKRGIPNIGNTCYINALVQCLFHLPHFNDYFVQEKYKGEKNGKGKDVVELYRALFLSVMRGTNKDDCSTLPLKRCVSKVCSLFIDWAQEDAHQFMKQLLGSIHEELNRIKLKPKYRQLGRELEGEELQMKAATCWSYQRQRDDSYLYDCFCGQLYNCVRCITCGHESQSFQNFLDLSLSIPSNARSLSNLLSNFFEAEKLADYYYCENCKKSSKKSTKTAQPWRCPKFLLIHLKRSQFTKKNIQPISIPESLTLKEFMILSSLLYYYIGDKSARFCQYSLCGIIMHEGVLEGGHYWCLVKQNGKWFEIDDDKVTQLSIQILRAKIGPPGSSQAYILFYSSLYC